jgi:hypothetical protein
MNKSCVVKPKPQPELPKALVMSDQLKDAVNLFVLKHAIPILSISSSFI